MVLKVFMMMQKYIFLIKKVKVSKNNTDTYFIW